jgi:cyclin-dependent kinase 7
MDSNVNVVLEKMSHDLEAVIHAHNQRTLLLTAAHTKQYIKMLLEGVQHCHDNFLLHRDIKPANCLLAHSGHLKLADFGLCRPYGSPDRNMSPAVCTVWYATQCHLAFGIAFATLAAAVVVAVSFTFCVFEFVYVGVFSHIHTAQCPL